jgi:hypothetical protein
MIPDRGLRIDGRMPKTLHYKARGLLHSDAVSEISAGFRFAGFAAFLRELAVKDLSRKVRQGFAKGAKKVRNGPQRRPSEKLKLRHYRLPYSSTIP